MESHGCHLIPLVFQPNPLTLSVLSFVLLMVHSPVFLSFSFSFVFSFCRQFANIFRFKRVRLVCMALVEQLQDGRWYVQLAALWL